MSPLAEQIASHVRGKIAEGRTGYRVGRVQMDLGLYDEDEPLLVAAIAELVVNGWTTDVLMDGAFVYLVPPELS